MSLNLALCPENAVRVPDLAHDRPIIGLAACRRTAGMALAILALALVLRTWGMNATYESSDQAGIPHLVCYSFGLTWPLANNYGLVLPVFVRAFAEVLSRLHLPIGDAAFRWPMVLVGMAQVALTFPLLRRLRFSVNESLVGMLCCALLPCLIWDAHFPWAHPMVWHFAGMVTLWAALAYFDDRRPWQLGLAATALFVHCLSSVWAFALPLTIGLVWYGAWKRGSRQPVRRRDLAITIIVLASACLAALAVMAFNWHLTGKGQLGHLLIKQERGAGGFFLSQFHRLPGLWTAQFGYLFGLVAAAGLVFGSVLLARGDRRGLLAAWGWLAFLPLALLTNWERTEPGFYMIETLYAAGILGTILLYQAFCRTAGRTGLRAAIMILAILGLGQMALGGIDDCVNGGRLVKWTGVGGGWWGTVQPDTGIKAAGWYVRSHVPMNAVIMSLHTRRGMEAPVAEYYLGRPVLAGYDLRPDMFEPLLRAVGSQVDVLIIRVEDRASVGPLEGFDLVCTFKRDGQPVRFIYARPKWSLPQVNEEIAPLNAEYDRLFVPRHVPIAMPAPPGFDPLLRQYQETVRNLKSASRNKSREG